MKPLLLFLVFLGLAACGIKPDDSQSNDTLHTDSATYSEVDTTFISDADAPEILASVERLIDEQETNGEAAFTLRVSASGYEYKTESVWMFDSTMNLLHCFQDWASEGSEGNADYIFRRDRLFAIREESGYDDVKDINIYHDELGGFAYRQSDSPDSEASSLDRKYFLESDRDIKNQFSQIVQLLRDNYPDITEDDPAILHLENSSNDEEMPGTEITDITIDRKLLEALIR